LLDFIGFSDFEGGHLNLMWDSVKIKDERGGGYFNF